MVYSSSVSSTDRFSIKSADSLDHLDSMGIEMIQKESALGSSTLMESARYQSVLETELARTIVKVQGVQSARVHLALPKPSVFVRDSRKATASVMLQLYPGRHLEPRQWSRRWCIWWPPACRI